MLVFCRITCRYRDAEKVVKRHSYFTVSVLKVLKDLSLGLEMSLDSIYAVLVLVSRKQARVESKSGANHGVAYN